jgi:hypothetical protein
MPDAAAAKRKGGAKVAAEAGGASSAVAAGLEDVEMTLDHSQSARRLRARKLAGLATKEINPRTMRMLFRLCDEDNSHEVSPAEIQRALVLLGFALAKDPVALTRLLVDIDDDKTGVVSEGEFMAFMGNTTRDALRDRLNGYVVDRCFVKATIWGRKGGANFVATEVVQPALLKEWLGTNLRGAGKRVWLDVCGFNSASFQLIADAVGVTLTELTSCALLQKPNLAVLPKTEGKGSRTYAGLEREARARFVMHLLTPSTNPLMAREFSIYDFMPEALAQFVSLVSGYEILEVTDRTQLIGYSPISSSPPAISIEQVAMLCVNDRCIVTVHAPAFDPDETDLSRLTVMHEHPEEDPLNNDGSVLFNLLASVREQLSEGSPSVAHLFKGSAKGLAVVIADAIMAHNFEMRDLMEDWGGILLADIRKGPGKLHMFHIAALDALSKGMRSALAPVAAALDPANWDMAVDATEDEKAAANARLAAELKANVMRDNEREKAKGHGTLAALQGDERVLDDEAPRAGADALAIAVDAGAGAGAMMTATANDGEGFGGNTALLKIFFEKQMTEFAELTADARAVMQDMDAKSQQVGVLYKLIENMQQDMMNRTLYALTLVTVIVLPFSILTGLFGMNFVDMAELDPLAANGGEGELGPSMLPITGYSSVPLRRRQIPAARLPARLSIGCAWGPRSALELTRPAIRPFSPSPRYVLDGPAEHPKHIHLHLLALQLAQAADWVGKRMTWCTFTAALAPRPRRRRRCCCRGRSGRDGADECRLRARV